MTTMTPRPVLLGSYAAKTCARATHNAWDVTVPTPESEPDPQAEQRKSDGRRFESEVVAAVLAALPLAVDLGHLEDDKTAHIAATMAHLAAGTPLILGGRLPDDVAGGRTGKPDLLVRAEQRADGSFGYHPGDVKHHRTLKPGTGWTALVSHITAPSRAAAVDEPEVYARYREDDCLQLAHYWRMLQAAGFAAAEPWGAILGNDAPIIGRPELVLTWHDLADPVFTTYSRSAGKAQRSALERHDHEHAFRLQVADVARQRVGAPTDPVPLVQPIGQKECGDCDWASVCIDTLPADELSNELREKLSVREYRALAAAGVRTVGDLAGADLNEVLSDSYQAEATHLRGLAGRLGKAQLLAELVHTGELIRRRDDAPDVPSADVEYDIDCEWGSDESGGFTYLWGVLRTEAGASTYTPFLDLAIADAGAEYMLLARFLRWLNDQIAADLKAGHSSAVFYYSSVAEPVRIRRTLAATGRTLPPLRDEATPDAWIDLLPYVRTSVDSRWGHGLKVIATEGAGFQWRDDEPGGLVSQTWYDAARAGDDAVKQRLLAYNEDDVRATHAARQWLGSLHPRSSGW